MRTVAKRTPGSILSEMADVAAIVVTRNRKRLLLECLTAIRGQSYPVSEIYIVDNASDDGTQQALAELDWASGPTLTKMVLPVNRGGAGGFAQGMARASTNSHDWLWIMDDDALPRIDALAQLMEAENSFPRAMAPMLLCSRVEWTDGRLHPMNVVAKAKRHEEFIAACIERKTVSIRAATFVSLLAQRNAVLTYGLPLAAYFLWMDDVEWTSRVLRHERGVLVPSSVVVHRTQTFGSTLDASPDRFYLFVRNCHWMLLRSQSFSMTEKIRRWLSMCYVTVRWLARRWWWPNAWWKVMSGFLRGLLPPPRVEVDSQLHQQHPANS
jgi:rhamnopyranosyl-N-acetylglucosaminyl-diphospho-decaprenol beta-1,3/1,4-galactofuranosyltransferase